MDKPYSLYIINDSGMCLFSFNFKKDIESLDPVLFSGFLMAINQFSDRLKTKLALKESGKKMSTLSSISFNINLEFIIEYMKPLTGAMIISKSANRIELRTFLKQVLTTFNNRYVDILENWDRKINHFKTFSNELELIFQKGQIFSYQIPKILKDASPEFKSIIKPLKNYLDGTKSIQEIAFLTNLSLENVTQRISKLFWYDFIDLSQRVDLYDIFEPRKELFYLLRSKHPNTQIQEVITSNPKHFELLRRINGFMTINELNNKFKDISIDEIKKIISYYLSKGAFLRKVKLFPQIIQISHSIKAQYTSDTLSLMFTLENMCDGELSLEAISEKIGTPIMDIKAVLNQLGNNVTYRKEYEF
ncbi:MAG: hypothetical protein ACFFD2_14135 [Promethearchaeota archaeon]